MEKDAVGYPSNGHTNSDIRRYLASRLPYRKLIHIRASAGIRRLDQVKTTLDYAPITTDVMLRAAELWAMARSAGLPTAGPDALDGDCILAAQALLSIGPIDTVTVATDNVAHLSRYVDAQLWETITG
jgi:hypothetical protein